MNVKNTFSKITIIVVTLLLVFCSCTDEEYLQGTWSISP